MLSARDLARSLTCHQKLHFNNLLTYLPMSKVPNQKQRTYQYSSFVIITRYPIACIACSRASRLRSFPATTRQEYSPALYASPLARHVVCGSHHLPLQSLQQPPLRLNKRLDRGDDLLRHIRCLCPFLTSGIGANWAAAAWVQGLRAGRMHSSAAAL